MLLFPAGSTPDEINDVIAELPDQESPITVIVGDTVVEDKVAPSETLVEPEQVKDITEPLTADDLPPVLENLTDTVIIPIVTNDNLMTQFCHRLKMLNYNRSKSASLINH